MWRVCAIAPSLVSGWRAFSFLSLCKRIIASKASISVRQQANFAQRRLRKAIALERDLKTRFLPHRYAPSGGARLPVHQRERQWEKLCMLNKLAWCPSPSPCSTCTRHPQKGTRGQTIALPVKESPAEKTHLRKGPVGRGNLLSLVLAPFQCLGRAVHGLERWWSCVSSCTSASRGRQASDQGDRTLTKVHGPYHKQSHIDAQNLCTARLHVVPKCPGSTQWHGKAPERLGHDACGEKLPAMDSVTMGSNGKDIHGCTRETKVRHAYNRE
jgi:hypothetical protein